MASSLMEPGPLGMAPTRPKAAAPWAMANRASSFEAMQQIRKIDRYKSTPILALTAKAMVGDKEKCIQCGASDYISKPVNMENLFSMMRVWLFKED